MKFALISLGCSKNLVDSENFIGILVNKRGFEVTSELGEADIIIVNTCGFIGDAKKESIETILEVSDLKINGNLKKIIVTGCLAQRYAGEILKELPEVDAVIGTGEIDKIEKVIEEVLADKRVVESTKMDFLADSETDRVLTTASHTAYLKIAEGCDRKCTYCIIPQLRGNLRSRTIEDILKEANKLVASGVRELNLLAQETTEYGIDLYKEKSLARLMKELVKIDGLKWLRTYYMFPDSLTDELIDVMKTEEKICKYFDIPVQHISDNILQQMGRAKSGNHIKGILNRIRKEIPDAVIRTAVIVGFPGETEEMFQNSYNLIEKIGFSGIHIFQYSDRENTIASSFTDKIDAKVKKERADRLEVLKSEMAKKERKKYIGKHLSVLLEEKINGYLYGYSENYLRVKIKDNGIEVNSIIDIKINSLEKEMLIAYE